MTVLIAMGHFVGAIFVIFLLGFGVILLAGWEGERNRKNAIEEMSLTLGLRVEEMDSFDNQERVINFAAAKFSSELFRNRLSDFCEIVTIVWGWCGRLIQVGIIIGVAWYTVTEDLSNAVHIWWIVAVAVFFMLSSIIFSLACRLLTGRFPGQARQARKNLASSLQGR